MMHATQLIQEKDGFCAVMSDIDRMIEKPIHMVITPQQVEELYDYCQGKGRIQELLVHYDPFEREFLKTGYSPESQEIIFGVKYAPKKKVFFSSEEFEEYFNQKAPQVVGDLEDLPF